MKVPARRLRSEIRKGERHKLVNLRDKEDRFFLESLRAPWRLGQWGRAERLQMERN